MVAFQGYCARHLPEADGCLSRLLVLSSNCQLPTLVACHMSHVDDVDGPIIMQNAHGPGDASAAGAAGTPPCAPGGCGVGALVRNTDSIAGYRCRLRRALRA
eukprot:scaffold26277_cov114-Isochrysis_galbana.AAC.8